MKLILVWVESLNINSGSVAVFLTSVDLEQLNCNEHTMNTKKKLPKFLKSMNEMGGFSITNRFNSEL